MRARGGATPSLAVAAFLLAGLVAGQAAAVPSLAGACALGGLALAAPGRWRATGFALALGLGLSWLNPDAGTSLPAGVSSARPVIATVHQRGAWQPSVDGWQVEVEVEVLRQGGVIAVWPARLRWYLPQRLAGSRWRLRGHLGRSASLHNAVASTAGPWRLASKSARLTEELEDHRFGAGALRRVYRWREAVHRRVTRVGESQPGGALAVALVLGEASALPEASIRGLRRVGLAHVTALSGLHLGVLAAWVAFMARRASAPWRWALIGGVTLLYLVLGGARPSLLRSWFMVAGAATALLSRRSSRSMHALAWSAVGLAALDPVSVGQLGFQLTFAASAGVVWGARALPAAWGVGRGRLTPPLAATLGAQLATLPLAVPAFHWLPLWAWCWNLMLVPGVALAVPLCFIWTGLALVAPETASRGLPLLNWAAACIGGPGALPAGFLGGMPWARGLVPTLVLGAVLLVATLRPRALAAAGLCLLLTSGRAAGLPSERTAVHFIDVGQGDAVLIRDGEGALMVDGGGGRGPGIARRALLPTLGRLGLRRIEVAILSHGDVDHCKGLLELAGYVPLRELWLAPAAARSDCGRRLLLTPGLRLRPLWAGETVTWRGWNFSVLGPQPGARGGNEKSLVLRASSRGRALFLTGDIGHRTEFDIVGRTAALESDLLKVAHHGSAGSTSLSFLRALEPTLAVVSVGRDNPFGHPAEPVLARLAAEGVLALRTDLSGQVEVTWTRGGPMRVRTPGAAQ